MHFVHCSLDNYLQLEAMHQNAGDWKTTYNIISVDVPFPNSWHVCTIKDLNILESWQGCLCLNLKSLQ